MFNGFFAFTFQTSKRTIGHEKFPLGAVYPVAVIKCVYLSAANRLQLHNANITPFKKHKFIPGKQHFI